MTLGSGFTLRWIGANDISKMSIKHNCIIDEFLLSVVIKPKSDLSFADDIAGSVTVDVQKH